jgi:hypothetical protein
MDLFSALEQINDKRSSRTRSDSQIKMTLSHLREQWRSFAYGNTHIENDRITREMVADIDARLEGKQE